MIPQHMADNFADAYPEELLREREAKLRSFWAGKGGRAILSLHDGSFPYRQIDDDDLIVENAVRTILASAPLSDAYLPWFGPDFGTISTAIYWGGEVIQPKGGNVFIKPIIHSAEQVSEHYPLAPEAGHCPRAIKLTQRVRERLETDQIWARLPDMQGPLSTASLLWEQEDFFCSMYTDPEAVHSLLDQVTTQLIGMVRHLQSAMAPTSGAVWPYIWQPEDLGITITEDMMPLLPPSLYREFGLPYLKRMADEFGGVFVHCCGKFEQHLPALAASGIHLRGFEYFEPETRTEAIFEHLGSSLVYVPSTSPQLDISYPDYLQHLACVAPADMRLYFIQETSWPDAAANSALIRKLFIE